MPSIGILLGRISIFYDGRHTFEVKFGTYGKRKVFGHTHSHKKTSHSYCKGDARIVELRSSHACKPSNMYPIYYLSNCMPAQKALRHNR